MPWMGAIPPPPPPPPSYEDPYDRGAYCGREYTRSSREGRALATCSDTCGLALAGLGAICGAHWSHLTVSTSLSQDSKSPTLALASLIPGGLALPFLPAFSTKRSMPCWASSGRPVMLPL
jgi:hypothetical protein